MPENPNTDETQSPLPETRSPEPRRSPDQRGTPRSRPAPSEGDEKSSVDQHQSPASQQGGENKERPPYQGGQSSGPRPPYQGGQNSGPRPPYQGGQNSGPRPPYQGGQNSGPRPPYQGGQNSGPRPPYQGGQNSGQRPPYQGGQSGGQRPPYQGGQNSGPRPPYQGGPGGGPRPPYQGGPGGGPRPPYQGGPGGGQRPPYQGGPGGGQRPPYQGGPGGGPRRSGAPSLPPALTPVPGQTPVRKSPYVGKAKAKPTYGDKKTGTKDGKINKPIVGRKGPSTKMSPKVRQTGPIVLPANIIVKDLAEMLEATISEIISKLIAHGVFANLNQVVDFKIAADVAKEFGFEPTEAEVAQVPSAAKDAVIVTAASKHDSADLKNRPPVVTVMGHVDHGKTSLLDAIRKSKVAAGEAGGITQHIGAYQVQTDDGRLVTFLDTPGHEAFTAMRARGAKVTDIAVIVVAADDGVMPQTLEAIDHARAAQVPIVIALNKIDRPNANPDFVKQQLTEHNVVIEEYGGDVICVPVSAKKMTGIEELLEMILLQSEVLDLKANPSVRGIGTVLEAKLDKSSGVNASVLVQEGTLSIGDIIVVGTISGKVRAMFDDTGTRVRTAGPSKPVSVLGLGEVPNVGDRFEVVRDEKSARTMINVNRDVHEQNEMNVSLDTLFQQMQQGKIHELNLLLKSDVQGSLDALRQVLTKAGNDQFKVRLIHEGVGNISEADVHLASASRAIVIGFNTIADGAAQRVAQIEHVDIRLYEVIYKLVDDVEAALKGMLEPVYKDVVEGKADILQIFKSGKTSIAGCRVTDGKLIRSATYKVYRNNQEIHTGSLTSLRRGKDDVREVNTGYECGVLFDGFNALQVGDRIEAIVKVRV